MKARQITIVTAVMVVLLSIGSASWLYAQEANDIFANDRNGSLNIYNQAGFDVVIFAGRVTNNIVMGGIKAGEGRNFDLAKLPLPAKRGSFLIRAVSFETYTRKNSQVSEEDVLYTRLVVYDLNDLWTSLDIYSGIDGTQRERFYVSNDSKFVVELRLDRHDGWILSTLSPFEENRPIFVRPLPDGKPYQIYPVYVYVDPNTNEITRFVNKSDSGQRRVIPTNNTINVVSFSGPKGDSDISYITGFLRLRNDADKSLFFKWGTMLLMDQKGRRLIMQGGTAIYEMEAPDSAGQVYTSLNMEFDSKTLSLTRLLVRPGVVYELTVNTQNGNPVYDIRETGYNSKNFEAMRMQLLFE